MGLSLIAPEQRSFKRIRAPYIYMALLPMFQNMEEVELGKYRYWYIKVVAQVAHPREF